MKMANNKSTIEVEQTFFKCWLKTSESEHQNYLKVTASIKKTTHEGHCDGSGQSAAVMFIQSGL